jgi:hypothetical protein
MTKYETGVAFSGMINSDNSPTRTSNIVSHDSKLNKKYKRAMKHKQSYTIAPHSSTYSYRNIDSALAVPGAGGL